MAVKKKKRTRSSRPGGRTAAGRFRKGYRMTAAGRYVKGKKKKATKRKKRRASLCWGF